MERVRRRREILPVDLVKQPVDLVEQIEEKNRMGKKKSTVEFLHSGSIILNLAASGKGLDGGWARGRIINLVGDGSSGKTLLAMETCAYAFYRIQTTPSSIFPRVKKVHIVYDNIEGVMDFRLDEMYKQEFVDGVEWRSSRTCEEFGRYYARLVVNLKPGEFLLYVADSLDAMVSKDAKDRIEKAIKSDKEKTDASYGTEKAKFFSQEFFNDLCERSQGKDATLICISQLRENIGITFGEKYHRTGGKALDFYTHQVCWLREVEKMSRQFRGKKVVYGIRSHAKMKRNKVAKPFREAEFRILFDHGVDDIGSMVDYLFGPDEKSVQWDGGDFKTKEDLIQHIQHSPDDYIELANTCEREWNEIEEAVKLNRKPKFT